MIFFQKTYINNFHNQLNVPGWHSPCMASQQQEGNKSTENVWTVGIAPKETESFYVERHKPSEWDSSGLQKLVRC